MKKSLLLLWFACASLASVAESQTSFTTTHVPGSEDWQFILPSVQAERYYTEAFLAVKIGAVYAGGVALVAEPHEHAEAAYRGQDIPSCFAYAHDVSP